MGGGGFALDHAVAGDGHDRDQVRYGPGFDGDRDGDRGGSSDSSRTTFRGAPTP